ncbi:MAG: EpsG family protein [Prevotella pallens]|jgi:putative membrane protein|uniref:EpsG family protein n=1 Tax=Prevotella pallens TaxID=60133 RepID=UPI001CB3824B|nr:EpsG family protein [Prevotella pallens]MBF1459561.1 EpsG family protein [Prevotella pallens]MBF1489541.1 EpsG family protein [Prevotella pallens]MBF1493055.1 EpsG family protein [Prevotella pallens]
MAIYILLFFIPVILYFYYNKKQQVPYKPFIIFFVALALFVGLGDMLGGYDRYIYGDLFDNLADGLKVGISTSSSRLFIAYHSEFGYVGLNWLIAHITNNRYIFIFCYTICMYAIIIECFKKYAKNYYLASILFMALVFFFSFTYLRQMFAAAIIGLSIKYIIERKFLRFCVILLVAFSFHNSAIIFFPIYFIANKKYSKSKILIIMFICFIVGITGITSSFYNFYDELSIRESHDDYALQQSTRIAYILEAGLFLYYLILTHRDLTSAKKDIVLYNIALGFCAILLLFIRSENGGRLSWYFVYGLIFSLTQLATTSYGRKIKMGLQLAIISFLLFFRILTSWGVFVYPYKTFLTNGHRENDYIFNKYEYDDGYDRDKFYR